MARIDLSGTGVSRGFGIGPARVYQPKTVARVRSKIPSTDFESEQGRLDDALAASRLQLEQLISRQKPDNKTAVNILKMHQALLDDPGLFGAAREEIEKKSISAEAAVNWALRNAHQQFSKISGDKFRERIRDIQDVGKRVLNNLMGVLGGSLAELKEPVILLAHDLAPSDTASLPPELVLGFATEVGGPTSHTAILARSLQIPAVVGVSNLMQQVEDGDLIIVNGFTGEIIIHPETKTEALYREAQDEFIRQERYYATLSSLPSVTVDGHPVMLLANIELASEIRSVHNSGAEGIGLYRTEYLFMGRSSLPSEEEQYQAYRNAAESMKKRPVVIRTLDIGGDKFSHALSMPEELNPFLGWRAVRFCLQNIDIFRTQLRAILRASVHGDVSLLYPLISGVGELRQINTVLAEVKSDLEQEGIPYNPGIKVGGMIEVPSAVMMVEQMAGELDFFSIGTNDLIQYTLAVDRGNARIAHLYQPLHPAVLKMIREVVRVGHEHNIPVDVCGEMASDPLCTLILLALGVERFSMSPVAIPNIKALLRHLRMDQARALGERVVEIPTAEQVMDYATRVGRRLVPDFPWEQTKIAR